MPDGRTLSRPAEPLILLNLTICCRPCSVTTWTTTYKHPERQATHVNGRKPLGSITRAAGCGRAGMPRSMPQQVTVSATRAPHGARAHRNNAVVALQLHSGEGLDQRARVAGILRLQHRAPHAWPRRRSQGSRRAGWLHRPFPCYAARRQTPGSRRLKQGGAFAAPRRCSHTRTPATVCLRAAPHAGRSLPSPALPSHQGPSLWRTAAQETLIASSSAHAEQPHRQPPGRAPRRAARCAARAARRQRG